MLKNKRNTKAVSFDANLSISVEWRQAGRKTIEERSVISDFIVHASNIYISLNEPAAIVPACCLRPRGWSRKHSPRSHANDRTPCCQPGRCA